MVHYSPNFGDKQQIMIDKGKECGFPSKFDMHRQFTLWRAELQRIISPNGLLYPVVEVKQRTHSGDEIDKRFGDSPHSTCQVYWTGTGAMHLGRPIVFGSKSVTL